MSRLCLALMSKSISFSSWASGVQAKSIEISIRIMRSSKRFLDYNMKLDGKDLTVNNPESRSLRALRLGKRNDEMGRLGIIGSCDVRSRGRGRTMRMRMKDRNKLFP